MKSEPIYSSFRSPAEAGANAAQYGIKVAQTLTDMMMVVAIRSAVFMSEQVCPYEEEFDGNDFCATHLIGYKGKEPIACIRMRFFAGFAKLERLAVRNEYRNGRMSFTLVRAALEFLRKKGYTKVYGHSQDRLVNFWGHFGFKPLPHRVDLVFSDFSYTELLAELEPHEDPITLASDPYVIIRPEGSWHRAGVLDDSAVRPATSPLHSQKAA